MTIASLRYSPVKVPLWRIAVLALAGFGQPSQANEKTFVAYAEEFPPYNFSANGQPTGVATEMLQALCVAANVTCKIEIVPWARAYRTALNHPNTLVFSTSRTPEREGQFLWIGPIDTRRVWLYVRADSPLDADTVTKIEGLKIGVVNGDSALEELKAAGIRAPAALDPAPTIDSNVQKLLGGRIDAMPAVELGMVWSLKQLGRNFDAVRPVLSYPAYDLYYAINRDSDPELVNALQRAWDSLQSPSWRHAIVGHYLPPFSSRPMAATTP